MRVKGLLKMKKVNLYKSGEEKFGYITSNLYFIFQNKITKINSFYKFVESDLYKRKFKTLIDIGCGTGNIINDLALKNKNLNLFGIDPSLYMIEIANKNKQKNTTFNVGSSTYIPFKIKFDIIISALSMHHWNDKVGSLIYLSDHLNKNGEIIIYEFLKTKGKGITEKIEYFLAKKHMVYKSDLINYGNKANLNIKNIKIKHNFIRVIYTKK